MGIIMWKINESPLHRTSNVWQFYRIDLSDQLMQTRLHHETTLLEIRKAFCIEFQQNLYNVFVRHVEEVH